MNSQTPQARPADSGSGAIAPGRSTVSATPLAADPAARTSHAAAELVGATKVYGPGQTAIRALDTLSVAFAAARFTAIMGPSGSGKSTLLQCAAGLDRLDSLQALIGGLDPGTLSDHALTVLRRDRLG
jgi:putative ABC transport system ATP-binding protein